MSIRIYVGNLAWATNDAGMNAHFAQVGSVKSAQVLVDRETGRSRGFGFVEMENDEDAKVAIEKLNGSNLDGRNITVNEAKPREEGAARGPRTGGFGGARSGGFGGGDRGGDRGNFRRDR